MSKNNYFSAYNYHINNSCFINYIIHFNDIEVVNNHFNDKEIHIKIDVNNDTTTIINSTIDVTVGKIYVNNVKIYVNNRFTYRVYNFTIRLPL